MAAELFTDSFEFRLVVRLLREMAPVSRYGAARRDVLVG